MSEQPPVDALAIPQGLAQTAIAVDKSQGFKHLKRQISWIPQIKMLQKMSGAVDKGVGKAGDFVFNNVVNLGDSFPCIIAHMQYAAMEFNGADMVRKSYTCVTEDVETFDGDTVTEIVGDKDFKEISEGQDDRDAGISYRWGVEVLVYVPSHRIWGNLFLGNQTARNNVELFEAFLGNPCLIYSDDVENKKNKNKWKGPFCGPLEDVPDDFHIPSVESISSAKSKFLPKGDGEEVAGETPPER